jgi:hypothetical protein
VNHTTKHQQPATAADIVSFLATPWLWLTLAVLGVTAYKAWDAEVTALHALTPDWFMPAGVVTAAIGIVVTGVLIRNPEAAPFAFSELACLVFLPVALFAVLQVGGMTDLPAFLKTFWGAVFVAAPWLGVLGAWDDECERDARRSVESNG